MEQRGIERNSPAEALGNHTVPHSGATWPEAAGERVLALKAAWVGSLASPDMPAGSLGSLSGGNCRPELLTHYPVTAARAMSARTGPAGQQTQARGSASGASHGLLGAHMPSCPQHMMSAERRPEDPDRGCTDLTKEAWRGHMTCPELHSHLGTQLKPPLSLLTASSSCFLFHQIGRWKEAWCTTD